MTEAFSMSVKVTIRLYDIFVFHDDHHVTLGNRVDRLITNHVLGRRRRGEEDQETVNHVNQSRQTW